MNTTTEETSGAELYYKVRRTRRRRDARSWTFVALAIVGLLWIPRVTMPALLRTTAGEPGWRIFRESKKGWTLTYPATWHAQRIAEQAHLSYHPLNAYGIFISNVDRELKHPKGTSNSWRSTQFDTKGLTSGFVAVRVQWSAGVFPIACPQWGSEFPLSLKKAKKEPSPPGDNDPPQQQLSLPFVARNDPFYSVTMWIGSAASAGDRAIVERIVSSISFDDAPKVFPTPPPPEVQFPECEF